VAAQARQVHPNQPKLAELAAIVPKPHSFFRELTVNSQQPQFEVERRVESFSTVDCRLSTSTTPERYATSMKRETGTTQRRDGGVALSSPHIWSIATDGNVCLIPDAGHVTSIA
jgi:hypothetical protein